MGEPPLAAAGSGGGSPGLALVFVLLAYGGWSEGAYLSAEVRDVGVRPDPPADERVDEPSTVGLRRRPNREESPGVAGSMTLVPFPVPSP